MFLASVLPNVAPSAAFTSDCTGISCTFDGTGSTDSDGTVQSYEWTFSDGEEAGGPNPQKDFPATGTYDVTLTVTDDGGLTSSATQQVSVVKPNVPPTAAFTTDVRVPRLRLRRHHVDRQRRHHRRLRVGLR